jgi:hypothetical protein
LLNRFRALSAFISFAAVFVGGDGGSHAVAQGMGGPEILVTPYLWIASIDATTRTPLPNAREVTSSAGFLDLMGHLKGIPFMGAFEIRQGEYGFAGDLIHLPVGTKVSTRNVFFSGGNADLDATAGTWLLLYRPYADPVQSFDAGVGARFWSFSADLDLNGGLLRPVSLSQGATWADPLIAARYHRELGAGFGVTGYGDVGGFGVGAHIDWQLMGTIDYVPNPWLTLRAGYRTMNFNYSAGNRDLGFNVQIKGPIIAGTIRF